MKVEPSERKLPQWQLERIDQLAGSANVALTSFDHLDSQINDRVLFSVVMSQVAPNVCIDATHIQPDSLTHGIREARRMIKEKEGRISGWMWGDLEARITPHLNRSWLVEALGKMEGVSQLQPLVYTYTL
ncbi:hypothetical protein CONPUDRAFT_152532 [Coniophora puteana RWD-64-598 SS2]|uniref:Uncharacterized protein n=1 Tax=Coniophora puteana (strain RWD-64-598) TaxID=741705 RepID=A0A5M3MXL5_CONPW|nr:uncharacterized protein CONPUDRAFT_152532 [Coniophora puteana RWD-64-598 SS2]EIW83514.1 hypothetical protein CONPUDRAFT_152532 [Coniophora puteana RWD-64-598 SS2]